MLKQSAKNFKTNKQTKQANLIKTLAPAHGFVSLGVT